MKKYIKPTIVCNTYVMFESVLAGDSGSTGEKCFAGLGRSTRGKECFHCFLGSGGTSCPWIDECILPFR